MLRGMWDLPRPGLKPVSPAWAGGFLTTAPPGKSLISSFSFTLVNYPINSQCIFPFKLSPVSFCCFQPENHLVYHPNRLGNREEGRKDGSLLLVQAYYVQALGSDTFFHFTLMTAFGGGCYQAHSNRGGKLRLRGSHLPRVTY